MQVVHRAAFSRLSYVRQRLRVQDRARGEASASQLATYTRPCGFVLVAVQAQCCAGGGQLAAVALVRMDAHIGRCDGASAAPRTPEARPATRRDSPLATWQQRQRSCGGGSSSSSSDRQQQQQQQQQSAAAAAASSSRQQQQSAAAAVGSSSSSSRSRRSLQQCLPPQLLTFDFAITVGQSASVIRRAPCPPAARHALAGCDECGKALKLQGSARRSGCPRRIPGVAPVAWWRECGCSGLAVEASHPRNTLARVSRFGA